MKASRWLCSLWEPRVFNLLVLVLIVTKPVNVAESSPRNYYEGVVGGNVTFYCPVGNPEKLDLLYLQKGQTFINGYHCSNNITGTWPNTIMDLNHTAIHMFGLNLSNAGEYECHFRYLGSKDITSVKLHLMVTAPFGKPSITKTCKDNHNVQEGCYVTCASHNGYPSQKITWKTAHVNSPTWKQPNNSEVLSSPTNKMLNISSTAYINCSSGEVNVSCSVGNITSDVISVCDPPPRTTNNVLVIVAVVIILGISVGIALLCLIMKKRKRGAASATVNDNLSEVVALNGEGMEEAP
ncbi:uncharacterized protein LOC108244624 [Kryptolebias marmoratus]|uniref:Uncharacterized LOC108244624 n=1 Tax=Kryptolebias marmoratus TaxID=37003 RepID=A0A3Q3A453_KRYMA|nr:uncharacterized protein LOC108244624 [Kryptolebias marmoratus]